ncbi:MAG: ATP-binding protein, partial [bacterium]|nr:ATP-binding protein [bacterium]
MGYLINAVQFVMGTVSLVNGISFYNNEKENKDIRGSLLIMGIAAALWCYGYGYMGMVISRPQIVLGRVIGMAGIVIYLIEMLLVVFRMIGVRKVYRVITGSLLGLYGLVDVIMFAPGEKHQFMHVGGRTAYYVDGMSAASVIHYTFICLVMSLAVVTGMLWLFGKKTRQNRKLILILILSHVFLMVSMLPDTILPMLGKYSFPSTCFGVTCSYFCLWYNCVQYNALKITTRNVGNYAYQASSVQIFVFDTERTLCMANHSAQEFFSLNTLEGLRLCDLFSIEADEEEALWDEVYSDRQTELVLDTRENNISCSLHFSVARNKKGKPYCAMIFVYDRSAEEKLFNELQAANHAKSDFLANMSHEIRTPINAILGMNEIILREEKDKNILAYAKDIRNASNTLLALINDILDFSKIESGKLEIIPVRYELSSIVHDCYSMIQMRAKEKNLKLVMDIDPALPSVLFGDEIRVRQATTNILTNAVKYTKSGSVTMKVRGQKKNGNEFLLQISVIDTGMGIREENKEALFDAFKRVDEKRNRSIEGTGLGLAITKQIVDLMNGEIGVESEYGKGSTFTISLPQLILDETPMGDFSKHYSENDNKDQYRESFHAPDAKILVVYDVQMNLTVVERLLARTMIQIDTVLSGEACLEAAQSKKYDLIFMDQMMPGMDGVETFAKLRSSDGVNAGTPVIILTANAIQGAREGYLVIGFSDYL